MGDGGCMGVECVTNATTGTSLTSTRHQPYFVHFFLLQYIIFFIFLEALFSFLVLGKYSHVLATRSERRCFNLHNCSTLLSYSLCTNTNRHYVQLPVFLTLYWSPKVEGMVSLPSSLLTSFLTLNSMNNV